MRAFFLTLRVAFAESWSNHTTFFVDAAFMILNNALWLFFWAVFFGQAGSVRGWDTQRVYVLMAMVAFVYGLTNGFFGESRLIGRAIAGGDLDALLLRPHHPLLSLVPRRVNAISIGDTIFGLALFVISTAPDVIEFMLFVGMGLLGCLVLTSFLILASSLTFFVDNDGQQGSFVNEAIMILSFYPTDVFGRGARVLLATVIPVSFVATIPARAVLDLHIVDVLMTCASAIALFVIAIAVFQRGLRRYSSGAGWA